MSVKIGIEGFVALVIATAITSIYAILSAVGLFFNGDEWALVALWVILSGGLFKTIFCFTTEQADV